jgi:hypothetical protein
MSTEHPITPPPELVGEWLCQDGYPWDPDLLATQAARWGADQELDACCKWADETGWIAGGKQLRHGC